MDTITIQLTNQKAYKLLEDMEELNLIHIVKSAPKLSSLRSKIKSRMTESDIDDQLNDIRKEWQRDI